MASEAKVERAVQAAAQQFLRYGYSRTTMGDISAAAGMSRPALYLLFPGKAEAFDAAVRHLNTLRIAAIHDALAGKDTLFERLCTVCEWLHLRVFELQRINPDAADLDDLSFPVVREIYGECQDLVAELIEQVAPPVLPASPAGLARNLVHALRGLGATANDMPEMEAMIRLEIDLLCRALGCR